MDMKMTKQFKILVLFIGTVLLFIASTISIINNWSGLNITSVLLFLVFGAGLFVTIMFEN